MQRKRKLETEDRGQRRKQRQKSILENADFVFNHCKYQRLVTCFGYNLLNITGGLHIIIIKLILWLEVVIWMVLNVRNYLIYPWRTKFCLWTESRGCWWLQFLGWGFLGGITDLAICGGFRGVLGQIQLVKTKQIHKLMLTMFDPEEIERTKCGVGSSLSLIARKVCNAADAKYRVLKVCMVW